MFVNGERHESSPYRLFFRVADHAAQQIVQFFGGAVDNTGFSGTMTVKLFKSSGVSNQISFSLNRHSCEFLVQLFTATPMDSK